MDGDEQKNSSTAVLKSERYVGEADSQMNAQPTSVEQPETSPPNNKRRPAESQDEMRSRGDAAPPTSKRARRGQDDVRPSVRSRRMFGLLSSTLNKANEDNARRDNEQGARKRAEIEARMQDKLKRESERIHQRVTIVEDVRRCVQELRRLAIDLEGDDEAVRLRKAQKRRLASFLITPSEYCTYDGQSEAASSSRTASVDGHSLAPEIALTLAPVGPRHPDSLKRPDMHPVYYLPKQMLDQQDDTLDKQEDRVDDAIDDAQQAWEQERLSRLDAMKKLQDELCQLKKKMDELDTAEYDHSRDEKRTRGMEDDQVDADSRMIDR